MKSRVFRIVSLVCISALLLSCTALASSVQAQLPEPISITVDNAKYDGGCAARVKAGRYYSGTYNYYDQLNELQQTVYNSVKAMTPGQTQLTVTIAQIPYESYDICLDLVAAGVFAVFKDYPEFFWLSGGYNASAHGGSTDGVYVYDVVMDFTFSESDGYSDPVAAKQQLDAAVEGFEVAHGSRYDMLLEIHDKICRSVIYSPCIKSNPPQHSSNVVCDYCAIAHEAAGVFLKYGTQTESYAVCEGYAEAFKLICDKFEIPCVLVVSTNHMWNLCRSR